jgi:hypothetical protein
MTGRVTDQLRIEVVRPVRATIGRFGKFGFPAGRYIYTGAASPRPTSVE